MNRRKLVLALVIFFAWCLAIYATRHLIAADTIHSQIPWWNYLHEKGFSGIPTIAGEIGGNYTSIWYFVIVLFSKLHLYPTLPIEYTIRIISISFTLASAMATFFILRHFKGRNSWTPVWGALATLFIPALFLDIMKTNLPDASYLCLCLFAYLAVLKNKMWLAWFLVGAGMNLKMMAMFLIPYLFFLWIRDFRKSDFKHWALPLWTLAGFLVCSIPGVIAGQSWYSATFEMIFLRTTEITRFSFYHLFQGNAERWNIFPVIDLVRDKDIAMLGYAIVVVIFSVVFYLLLDIKGSQKQKAGLDYLLILSPIVMFLFMPAQHEGYFALASIFALIVMLLNTTKTTVGLFILLTFLMWQGYHGFGATGGFLQLNDYLFIFLGLIAFLIYKISLLSNSAKNIKAITNRR